MTAQAWATYITALVSVSGFLVVLARVGSSAVRSNTTVANSVAELSDTVKRIEQRMEGYIASENIRDGAMENWRRGVDSRLATIEATLGMLTARSGRRRTDH